MIGEPYEDADGVPYLPMFRQPVLVFEGTKETLTAAHPRALSRALPRAVFTSDLFTTGNDRDNRAAVRAVPPPNWTWWAWRCTARATRWTRCEGGADAPVSPEAAYRPGADPEQPPEVPGQMRLVVEADEPRDGGGLGPRRAVPSRRVHRRPTRYRCGLRPNSSGEGPDQVGRAGRPAGRRPPRATGPRPLGVEKVAQPRARAASWAGGPVTVAPRCPEPLADEGEPARRVERIVRGGGRGGCRRRPRPRSPTPRTRLGRPRRPPGRAASLGRPGRGRAYGTPAGVTTPRCAATPGGSSDTAPLGRRARGGRRS